MGSPGARVSDGSEEKGASILKVPFRCVSVLVSMLLTESDGMRFRRASDTVLTKHALKVV